jgi:hypothetical protein
MLDQAVRGAAEEGEVETRIAGPAHDDDVMTTLLGEGGEHLGRPSMANVCHDLDVSTDVSASAQEM